MSTMLLVQPAIPLSTNAAVGPLPGASAAPAMAGGVAGSVVVAGGDSSAAALWPADPVAGLVGEPAAALPWLTWGEPVSPAPVSTVVGAPAADPLAGEPFSATPDLGGIALLLGGLLVLAGWRHARR